MPIRIDLGCGRNKKPGCIGLDRNLSPDVDILVDAEAGIPLRTESVDEVNAAHVLEHFVYFERAMHEIWRVLKFGGLLVVRVPYGFNCNPYHRRYFDENAVKAMTRPGSCTDETPGNWLLVSMCISNRGFPWWHMQKYLQGWPSRLPLGRKQELTFVLMKGPPTEPLNTDGA